MKKCRNKILSIIAAFIAFATFVLQVSANPADNFADSFNQAVRTAFNLTDTSGVLTHPIDITLTHDDEELLAINGIVEVSLTVPNNFFGDYTYALFGINLTTANAFIIEQIGQPGNAVTRDENNKVTFSFTKLYGAFILIAIPAPPMCNHRWEAWSAVNSDGMQSRTCTRTTICAATQSRLENGHFLNLVLVDRNVRIEIHNSSDSVVSTKTLFLTDSDNLRLWKIPRFIIKSGSDPLHIGGRNDTSVNTLLKRAQANFDITTSRTIRLADAKGNVLATFDV